MQVHRRVLCASLFLLLLFIVSVPVAATGNPPVASFTGSPASGTAPLTVNFTDSSSGSPTGWAWFFGDEDYSQPWTEMTGSVGWSARYADTAVVLPDSSILLMGGFNGSDYKNDTWRSTDNGTTWTQMTAGAEWTARGIIRSVALPDGSIVVMGGTPNGGTYYNDTWLSTDNGATWTQQTASAGWTARHEFSSVAIPDGSIVLMGGNMIHGNMNESGGQPIKVPRGRSRPRVPGGLHDIFRAA